MSNSRLSTTASLASKLISSSSRVLEWPEFCFHSASYGLTLVDVRVGGGTRGDDGPAPGEASAATGTRLGEDVAKEDWLRVGDSGDVFEERVDWNDASSSPAWGFGLSFRSSNAGVGFIGGSS